MICRDQYSRRTTLTQIFYQSHDIYQKATTTIITEILCVIQEGTSK